MASDKRPSTALGPVAKIEGEAQDRIFEIRGQRVVLDSDLAEFYGVETRQLSQQVERNSDRFPSDFAFRLTRAEVDDLKSQNVISTRAARRSLPRVFTEHGALAASGVLKSERAAEVSVAVSRAFVAMRDELASLDEHPLVKEMLERMGELEEGSEEQRKFNKALMETLGQLRPLIDAVNDQAQDSDLD